MKRGHALALIVVAIFAVVFGVWGSNGAGILSAALIPVALAILVTWFARTKLPLSILVGAASGFVPAIVLAVGYEFFGGDPPSESIIRSKEAAALVILIVLGIPCVVAGAIGGSIGGLLAVERRQSVV